MKTKHDYTDLDAAILDTLKNLGTTSFAKIFFSIRAAGLLDGDRAIDRRLQAMRKAGKIGYSRKPEGWSLAKTGGAS